LAQNSQTDPDQTPERVLEGQIRQVFGRVVYSHKAHEKCVDIALTKLNQIKLWQIALSAVATAGFVGTIFGVGHVAAIVGAVISTTLLALNTYTKDFDLGKIAQRHKQTAADLWHIREKLLSMITDLWAGTRPLEQIRTERDALIDELHSIYSQAPSTDDKAYKKAQIALKQSEELTFSEDEIDVFLPTELRRGKKNG
jgi:hypothetical protein